MHLSKNNLLRTARAICLALLFCQAPQAWADDHPQLTVRHLAREHNLISIHNAPTFLLLPVQDSAPEAKLTLIGSDNRAATETVNVRLSREHTDYYVPLDLSAFLGTNVTVDVQGMPANSSCWKSLHLSDTFDTTNRENFRPLYHHTPLYGWMNDPNGMFYLDGTWHLYYQHNPYGSTWGNMTWGHSTSRDLIHWQAEPNAILPDALGTIFSGSAVVDHQNTAGFGPGAIIAFYTSAKATPWGDSQSQSMAYSTDGGRTFTKYAGNPVITSDRPDFRDPKVFWYAPARHWCMILAVGQQMEIYSSPNLREWKKESSFGLKHGAHGGVWECPDLVELPIEGTDEKKWVLICNINPGGPFGGNATQYFVGTFDGKRFTNESPTRTKWMDWGKDHYATVTFSNAPDGRTVALGWMSNWQYQAVLPTSQYRGANTLARELSLYRSNGELLLRCAPVREMEQARRDAREFPSFTFRETHDIPSLLDDNHGSYEIELELRSNGAERIDIILSNDREEELLMYYDVTRSQFVMDRSRSGLVDFNADFPAMTVAPASCDGTIRLRLFVDRSSIEAFGNGGEFVMTNRLFPSAPYNRLAFACGRGSVKVTKLNIYRIK